MVKRKRKFDFEHFLYRATERFLHEATAIVESDAVRRAPFLTGELKANINRRVELPERGIVSSNAPHAVYVEYGTGIHAEGEGRQEPWVYYSDRHKQFFWNEGQHPQPYMRPALDNNRKALVRLFQQHIRSEVKR